MGFWNRLLIRIINNGWEEIRRPPRWVLKAEERWLIRLRARPYNQTKDFLGDTFIYRVRYGCEGQGMAPLLGWYKKKKI